MLTILGVAMIGIAAMLLFPHSSVAKFLSRWLVETPASALNRIPPGKAVFYALLAAIGLGLVLAFEAEGLRLFGLMLPETLVWFALFDVGIFIDALLITSAVLATNGVKAARAQVQAAPRRAVVLARRCAACVSRARRPVRPPSRPSGKTDDEGPGWAADQAAYRALSMA